MVLFVKIVDNLKGKNKKNNKSIPFVTQTNKTAHHLARKTTGKQL